MFMRFWGGGVGPKSTHKVTRCLLDDCETLDKEPFTLKNDSDPFQETGENDVPMEGTSNSEGDESDESSEQGSDIDSVGGRDDEPLIVNELADEMDEYGYTGLDQTLDKNEGDAEISGDEDALRPEDGEDPDKIDDTTLCLFVLVLCTLYAQNFCIISCYLHANLVLYEYGANPILV